MTIQTQKNQIYVYLGTQRASDINSELGYPYYNNIGPNVEKELYVINPYAGTLLSLVMIIIFSYQILGIVAVSLSIKKLNESIYADSYNSSDITNITKMNDIVNLFTKEVSNYEQLEKSANDLSAKLQDLDMESLYFVANALKIKAKTLKLNRKALFIT
ncbi:hypothetical protein [Mycoplasmopsis verecunda]|nr:hypothetical protein [Mycoplasmopsis verecunda]WPB54247.1 hypothetical protein SAM46_02045 [Mycoplasmopsis verecunda]